MSERDETAVLFGMPFSITDFDSVCANVDARVQSREPGFIATPNVNLVCNFQRDPVFREAYQKAMLWLPDGKPLMWAARLLGVRMAEKLSGSDMVPWLSAYAAQKGYSVFFFGGLPGSAEIAAQRLRQRYPDLKVAGTHCPPYGFENDPEQNAIAIHLVQEAKPDIMFVALGTPKQEVWLNNHQRELGVPVSMGVGAALDFLSGKVRRAPRWVQRCGLEWVWRLVQEPRRLWRRYLVRDMMIIRLVIRELIHLRRSSSAEDSSHA